MTENRFTGWRKSSRSSGDGNCVEVAFSAEGSVGIRDSKQYGRGPVLRVTPSEWTAFLDSTKEELTR